MTSTSTWDSNIVLRLHIIVSTHIWALSGHGEGAAQLDSLAGAHGAAGGAGSLAAVILHPAELNRQRHGQGSHLQLKQERKCRLDYTRFSNLSISNSIHVETEKQPRQYRGGIEKYFQINVLIREFLC